MKLDVKARRVLQLWSSKEFQSILCHIWTKSLFLNNLLKKMIPSRTEKCLEITTNTFSYLQFSLLSYPFLQVNCFPSLIRLRTQFSLLINLACHVQFSVFHFEDDTGQSNWWSFRKIDVSTEPFHQSSFLLSCRLFHLCVTLEKISLQTWACMWKCSLAIIFKRAFYCGKMKIKCVFHRCSNQTDQAWSMLVYR